MKILLVGNYLPDAQQSMQRFATMLHDGLRAHGHEVHLLRPPPRFGQTRIAALRKWAAYVDKYLIFPRALRQAAKTADVVHICDHSNAMYVAALDGKPHVVTCHDLLAVRGALGEKTDCPASFTGRILQRWILGSLRKAQMIACVSSATREDLLRLVGEDVAARSCVILLGVAGTIGRKNSSDADALLADLRRAPGRPFLLNVGSNLRRKNREGALRIFRKVSEQFDCDLIFAGEPLSAELKRVKKENGLNGRVIKCRVRATPSSRLSTIARLPCFIPRATREFAGPGMRRKLRLPPGFKHQHVNSGRDGDSPLLPPPKRTGIPPDFLN